MRYLVLNMIVVPCLFDMSRYRSMLRMDPPRQVASLLDNDPPLSFSIILAGVFKRDTKKFANICSIIVH